jgi:hypothetical protein
MLIYSMSVSVDGFIADREGGFEWTAPSEELSLSHRGIRLPHQHRLESLRPHR